MVINFEQKIDSGIDSLIDSIRNWDVFDNSNAVKTGTTLPALNVLETGNDFRVCIAAPGLQKSDFKVNIENYMLTVSVEKDRGEQDGKYHRREFDYSSFTRTVKLMETIDSEKISATYTDGILKIVILKKEEAKTKPAREIKID